MKKEQLFEAIGTAEDELLERSEIYIRKSHSKLWLSFGASAACLCFLFFGLKFFKPASQPDWPIKQIIVEDNSDEIAYLPHWEDLSISEQYNEFLFSDRKYSSKAAEISRKELTQSLGAVTLNGFDQYSETLYTIEAQVYGIRGISEECALAVKFEETESYFVYVNSYYRPATLGNFIDDLNLKETIHFGSVWYETKNESGNAVLIEFTNLPSSVVWDLLLSEPELENIHQDSNVLLSEMSVSVDIPLLGYSNISLSVTKEGYLTTNILDTGKSFYLGETKVNKFINYVLEHCEGHQIEYIVTDSVPEAE